MKKLFIIIPLAFVLPVLLFVNCAVKPVKSELKQKGKIEQLEKKKNETQGETVSSEKSVFNFFENNTGNNISHNNKRTTKNPRMRITLPNFVQMFRDPYSRNYVIITLLIIAGLVWLIATFRKMNK